ncbi:type I 3-dehydroquinate dehydratase [Candidatus Micrarchaeota archaeon]|nr:type I 3-dehydroquinate dehydratase [Candidatus Micrarchaeota archaeon]
MNVCVSIGDCSVEECIKSLQDLELAEIRLDKINAKLSTDDVKNIFSQKLKLIATCRATKTLNDTERKNLLLSAIDAGAAYVDIEVEASDAYKNEILNKAKSKGCKIIISYHNYESTPKKGELEQIVNWCLEAGDIAKIACKVQSQHDNARLLSLLDTDKKIIVIGMGEKGKITRIVAPLLGSPFTYASLKEGKETAEGQISVDRLKELMRLLK